MILDLTAVLQGIQFLLGAQLILVAVLHFLSRPTKAKVWLAILSLIHGLWFFKHVFENSWGHDILLFILIGPAKPIFVGSILLFYYKALANHLGKRDLIIHLLIPGCYYVALVVVRFFLESDIPMLSDLAVSNTFTLWMLVIFWFYFLLTRQELMKHTKSALIPRAYRRTQILFYSLYFFLLQIPIWDLIHRLSTQGKLTGQWRWFQTGYEGFFQYAGYNAAYAYLHFLGYFVFLYGVSELPFIKRVLLPKRTAVTERSFKNQALLSERISQFFFQDEAFKDPDLTLESCATTMEISKTAIAEYLKVHENAGFKDFVNQLRVNEFKRLIHDEAFARYDLLGIAFECGFKSKSTFHRVFKEKEGVTPSEYKKQEKI